MHNKRSTSGHRRKRQKKPFAMPPLQHLPRLAVILLAMVCLPISPTLAEPSWADAQKIFSARCTVCHSGKDAPLGLRLDTLEDALKGSARGPVLKPKNAKESELIRRVKGESQPRMPLIGDPLSGEEIARLEAWVAAGLPAGEAAAPAAASPEKVKPIDPNQPPTFAEVEPIFLKRARNATKIMASWVRRPRVYG
jgi:mono/diheme cytochrome c family protein